MVYWLDAFIKDKIRDRYYGNLDEARYQEFQWVYSIPIVHDYIDAALDEVATEQYLSRYGMTLADVKDPRKLQSLSSGSNLHRHQIDFVSRTVEKLYRR